MEFYEKKVTEKRYITGNKPKRGYYYVIDTLDNCPVGFFQTKGEAEREAETLNGFTDGNGRLKVLYNVWRYVVVIRCRVVHQRHRHQEIKKLQR